MLFRSPGIYVRVGDTVESFAQVLEGRHDNLSEDSFYMVGDIEGAVAKARRLGA